LLIINYQLNDPKRFFMDTAPVLTKTSDLDKRFNIGKNTRVNRLAMLGMTPDKLEKQGRFYYLTPEQVELFIDFDQYILQTGSTEGYPKLLKTQVELPIANENNCWSDSEEDVEESQDLMESESSGFLVKSFAPEITSMPAVEAEYDYPSEAYQPKTTTQILVANAQHRATALMLAENALVEQYMNNPSLLNPELRAQIESFNYREIDPKELAASLIAGAQSYVGGAA
jgi:hypothetical protein